MVVYVRREHNKPFIKLKFHPAEEDGPVEVPPFEAMSKVYVKLI